MLFTGVMVMTTMATACELSFPEVEGEEEVAVEAAAEAAGEVAQWDPPGDGTVPPPDDRSTGLSCQVGDLVPPSAGHLFLPGCPSECVSLTPALPLRSTSQWKLAGPEGSHARGR